MKQKSMIRLGVIAALAIPAILLANSWGPQPRFTGAPGDDTCIRCHNGALNPDKGDVEVQTPSASYTPGVRQSWTIHIDDSEAATFGFQLTVRPASDPQFGQAGRLESVQDNTFVICENGSERIGDESCMPAAPIEFIQHGPDRNSDQVSPNFLVDWQPPDTDIGDVTIYVAANASNNNSGASGDRIYTAELTLSPGAALDPPVIRDAQPVLQAFDNAERLAPGTYVQIFGQSLAPSTRQWAESDFDPGLVPGGKAPTSLDGVEVLINGLNAYVSFISPNQINAQVPDGIGEGVMNVEVKHSGGTSNSVTVTAAKVSPAMQQDAAGRWTQGETEYVMALHPSLTEWVGPVGLLDGLTFRPVKPGDTLILFVLGCGTDSTYPAGQIPATAAPLAPDVEVRIGDVAAEVTAVASPQFVGLFQFAVTVPNVGAGPQRITLSVDGADTGQTLFTEVGQP